MPGIRTESASAPGLASLPHPQLEALERSTIYQHLLPRSLGRILLRSVARAIDHDCFNLAQSSAYAAIVALFPALIVLASFLSLLPDTAPLRFQLSLFFDHILPSDVSPIIESYIVADSPHSARVLVVAGIIFLTSTSGLISILMEGIRRAHQFPQHLWSFRQRRTRALLLVPLSMVPFAFASLLIVFGHYLTLWLASHLLGSAKPLVYAVAFLLRWSIAFAGSVVLTGLLYYIGTPRSHNWRNILPGAIMATLLWFVSTLLFGLYVTRFANYTQVYGSLGAGIALLFWLCIICLSVLCGAEFNVQFQAQCEGRTLPATHGPTEGRDTA
ncbi:MAG TPA: YihY/virulence factor BrkB family protein [Granulicella sp.]